MERMEVPPGREGSWEDILHRAGEGGDRLLLFDEQSREASGRPGGKPVGDRPRAQLDSGGLMRARGHRAIGVVYRPEYEHLGNYVPTVLPRRYDAFLYLDETEALHPLPVEARQEGEVPETFPSGV